MSAPESLRDEVAAVLVEHAEEWFEWHGEDRLIICLCGWEGEPEAYLEKARLHHFDHVADALLASPALARVIREVEGVGDE